MDLLALTDFNLVAAHGSLGQASRASGRSKATLSRRIAQLEQSLGVRLIERGARSTRLTEEGRVLHARTETLLSEIGDIGRSLPEDRGRASGRLRVSAPVLFSHLFLGRLAAAFVERYPDVLLEIVAEDRLVDPVEEGYDVVIRGNPSTTDALVGRCFLRDEMLLVAPANLTRPESGAAGSMDIVAPAVVLANHRDGAVWRFIDEDGPRSLIPQPVLRLGSMLMIRDAVREGAGVALLPGSFVERDIERGGLVAWGRTDHAETELWALHTSRWLVPGKVRAFVDFLCESFAATGSPKESDAFA